MLLFGAFFHSKPTMKGSFPMNPIFWIGQGFSILAVIISFISYQMKTSRGILVTLSLATVMSCIAYAFLGGWTGLGLNVMCIIRNVCYYFKDKPVLKSKLIPVILTVIMGILRVFLWEGYHSIFFVVGIMLNTLAMGYFGPQNLRKSILLTSSLILIYNLFIPSYGGVFNESVSIASAIIGLIRYRKTVTEGNEIKN